jgi:hypothetical protein
MLYIAITMLVGSAHALPGLARWSTHERFNAWMAQHGKVRLRPRQT